MPKCLFLKHFRSIQRQKKCVSIGFYAPFFELGAFLQGFISHAVR